MGFMKPMLFLILTSMLAYASFAQDKNETQIRALLMKQSDAWNRGDLEKFMEGYWENDSLMFIGKSGITYGWKNTLNNYMKGYPDTANMGKLQFTLINFKKLSRKYYHVTGRWFLKRSVGDIGGHFTLLFEKIRGRWMIIADHSS